VLDFINGGHLFFQLYRAGTFDEPLARLYTAELVLAVAHLHSLGFVHRDLKPENVLLDGEGHVRVTDFGLAKGDMGDAEHQRTNSFIGTVEYMAPEVVAGRGHGKAVDWWSVGVLLYEMLCGVPPWRARSRAALGKLITAAKFKLPGAPGAARGFLCTWLSGSGSVLCCSAGVGQGSLGRTARECPRNARPALTRPHHPPARPAQATLAASRPPCSRASSRRTPPSGWASGPTAPRP
jgi:serine/threonine protein kinase